MNLLELKDKIASHLSTLTIDDYYLDTTLSSTRALFQELTGFGEDDEIEQFLVNQIPNTNYQAFEKVVKNTIAKYNERLDNLRRSVGALKSKTAEFEQNIADKLDAQKAIPSKKQEIENAIASNDLEINQIKPLAAQKADYAIRIASIERENVALNQQMAVLLEAAKQLVEEIAGLEALISEKQVVVDKEALEIEEIESTIKGKQAELQDLEAQKDTYFVAQAEALDYLLGILLCKRVDNSSYFRIESFGRIHEKKPLSSIGEAEQQSLIGNGLRNTAVLPKDWRRILASVLTQNLPDFSGSWASPNCSRVNYLKNECYDLSGKDIAIFLALKTAVLHGYHVQTFDNTIALAMSGGIMAKIQFRPKGNELTMFQDRPFMLFAKVGNEYNGAERFVAATLFQQTGYADSELKISIPIGYYILSEKFVVDISFEAAPILLGADTFSRVAPNIAGITKLKEDRYDSFWDDDDY